MVLRCRLADIIDNNSSGCRGRRLADIHPGEGFLRGFCRKVKKKKKKKKSILI
jgi:hypothetical protein